MASFKEDYPKFTALGAQVLGISSDSLRSHQRFAEKLGLNYPLLSDPDMAVIKEYGLVNDRESGARRSLFVVDSRGIIRHANTEYRMAKKDQYQALFQVLEAIP